MESVDTTIAALVEVVNYLEFDDVRALSFVTRDFRVLNPVPAAIEHVSKSSVVIAVEYDSPWLLRKFVDTATDAAINWAFWCAILGGHPKTLPVLLSRPKAFDQAEISWLQRAAGVTISALCSAPLRYFGRILAEVEAGRYPRNQNYSLCQVTWDSVTMALLCHDYEYVADFADNRVQMMPAIRVAVKVGDPDAIRFACDELGCAPEFLAEDMPAQLFVPANDEEMLDTQLTVLDAIEAEAHDHVHFRMGVLNGEDVFIATYFDRSFTDIGTVVRMGPAGGLVFDWLCLDDNDAPWTETRDVPRIVAVV